MAETQGDSGNKRSMTRKELYHLLRDQFRDKISKIYTYVEEETSHKLNCNFVLTKKNKTVIRTNVKKIDIKWQEVSRTENKFLKKFENWLKQSVILVNEQVQELGLSLESTSQGRGGRPSVHFSDASERTKRRKTEDIRKERNSEELAYATRMSLRAEGKSDAAHILKDITFGSPSKPIKYRKSLKSIQEQRLFDDEALSLIIGCRLSKSQYQILSQTSQAKNCKLYPYYGNVLKAKKKCYPNDSTLTITESKASVSLQGLLDHIVYRILLTQSEVIKSFPSEKVCNLILICKWGCDGTSGQSSYKQKFNDGDRGTDDDASIFFISLVPLELSSAVDKEMNSKIIVWKNPRPSSTRFCRPIKIQFLHETAEVTRKEVEEIKEQEENLSPFHFVINGKEVTGNYKLSFTMVDGKICNSVANVSSSLRCYLCQATSKSFNEIDNILERPIYEQHLKFDISSLHAWIRFFECCLHLSYRLETKKWQNHDAGDKEIIEKRKKLIQKSFREQLGLIVDYSKQGYGSTNDGNTARRFFQNSTIFSNITGVDENLIKKFHIILQVISSGFEVNVEKFNKFSIETARHFVNLYPWFYMPTTVHKILIHGHVIIDSALLPIGQMSEEAQESCNKFIKRYREDFAHKCSRQKNLEDVFRRLLVASDPWISNLRKTPPKHFKSLIPEALELLVSPSIEYNNDISDSE